jgi:hypothetical protein
MIETVQWLFGLDGTLYLLLRGRSMEMCGRWPYSRGAKIFSREFMGSSNFSPTIRAGGPRVFPDASEGVPYSWECGYYYVVKCVIYLLPFNKQQKRRLNNFYCLNTKLYTRERAIEKCPGVPDSLGGVLCSFPGRGPINFFSGKKDVLWFLIWHFCA